MAEISAAAVKELREKTGVGMMDCKKALAETNGDMDAAIDLLRKKGMAKAASKGSRIAAEGLVGAYVAADNKSGVLVEVNCETDFVAKNDEFMALVENAGKFIAEKAPNNEGTGEDLNALPSWEAGKTVDESIKELIQKIGENIKIRRYVRYQITGEGTVASYIHMGGKIGVLIELAGTGNLVDAAKDVAMHVAASQPQYCNREDVPADQVAKEKEILMAQQDVLSKPEAVREKMVEGRINKFLEQICLVEQPFVKNPDVTVGGLLKQHNATIVRFTRYGLGEGIEKKVDDFAAEVASYMGKA
jgi:elongation factor Ts